MIAPVVKDENSFYLLDYSRDVGTRLGPIGRELVVTFNKFMVACCGRDDLPAVQIKRESGTSNLTVKAPHQFTVSTPHPDVLMRSLARLSNLPIDLH